MMEQVPVILQAYGKTPLEAVQGAIKSEHNKFKKAVYRAARRILPHSKMTRRVEGKNVYIDMSQDAGKNDNVNETACKILLLLQQNPAAVGDELVRTWLNQPIGTWKADESPLSDYFLDNPDSAAVPFHDDDTRQQFEPITMAVVGAALLALAPIVIPIILQMVQDFMKSEQDKQNDEREKAAKEEEDARQASAKKTEGILYIVGGVLAVGAIAATIYYFTTRPKKAAAT